MTAAINHLLLRVWCAAPSRWFLRSRVAQTQVPVSGWNESHAFGHRDDALAFLTQIGGEDGR